jgi:hypothetical protein
MFQLYVFFSIALLATVAALLTHTWANDKKIVSYYREKYQGIAQKLAEIAVCFWFCEYAILFGLYVPL